MIKILIIVLAVLIVASGAVSAAAGVDESVMESLQLWTRQLFQEQVELQTQEQTQARVEMGQPVTGQDTPLQIRLRLENQEMLHAQNRIQSRQQIQLDQAIGPQDGTGFQWGMEAHGSDNSYGPGSIPEPVYAPQTGDGHRANQRGRP